MSSSDQCQHPKEQNSKRIGLYFRYLHCKKKTVVLINCITPGESLLITQINSDFKKYILLLCFVILESFNSKNQEYIFLKSSVSGLVLVNCMSALDCSKLMKLHNFKYAFLGKVESQDCINLHNAKTDH